MSQTFLEMQISEILLKKKYIAPVMKFMSVSHYDLSRSQKRTVRIKGLRCRCNYQNGSAELTFESGIIAIGPRKCYTAVTDENSNKKRKPKRKS